MIKINQFRAGHAQRGFPDYEEKDFNNHKLTHATQTVEKNYRTSLVKSLFNSPLNL